MKAMTNNKAAGTYEKCKVTKVAEGKFWRPSVILT